MIIKIKNSKLLKLISPSQKNIFFGKKLSDKYGKPCCRYGQDGLPMEKDKAERIFHELKSLLPKWKLNEDRTKLEANFFCSDYLKALDFVNEVGKLDSGVTKNTPSVKIEQGNFLKLSLYSPSLKGLSQVDFQLGLLIANIPYEKFDLIQVENEENYEKEGKSIIALKKSKELQQELLAQEGKAK